MDSEKYQRSVSLLCPTCGGTQFEHDESDDESGMVKCAECGLELTREQLISENGELIEAKKLEIAESVRDDAAKELRRTLKNAFRGSKNIRIR